MENDLEKAEQTAVDAARAMIKVFDFAWSVLEELSKAVAEASGLRPGRNGDVRLSMQDARMIHRYTKSRSYGEARVQRYLYSLLSIPTDLAKESKDLHPFLLVSLVNAEGRPPGVVYGIIEKIDGQEKTDRDFVDLFLLWLNEQLNEICSQTVKKDYGWVIKQELSGRADVNKLTARVLFQVTGLFDIATEEDLAESATKIGDWFTEQFSRAPLRA